MESSLGQVPSLEPGLSSTPFFLFFGWFTIAQKFEVELGFELKFFWVQIQDWAQIFLKIKTQNQWKVWIPSSYLKLVALLVRCVEISYGLQAFSSFLHKEIHKNDTSKNGHLYTCVDLSPNSLLGETLKKTHNLFLKSYILLNSKLRTKVGFPNMQLMVFYQSNNFDMFYALIDYLNKKRIMQET